eukprot:CAMPEP_0118706476 /NCGR_PEP_ID=MMETSP0800-20121206/20581_1 /TAXON_ID=210618 ORGANISM="Striatella unipunctata, Strain CCMP2910" /NCGR_SAMPLE_ID=MMETSP0800 /ASSEMBLY_ACC=CAM_ASM_000638 /LENGTH=251 /DNA_ID=CAMNT_0006609019 /DNA_START=1 /DNA_END=756 /DNA_ORIENTATION=-
MALTTYRASSQVQFTSYILAAFDLALSNPLAGSQIGEEYGTEVRRLEDLLGPEPLDLLRVAQKTERQEARGYFADIASGEGMDPILELQSISTGSLLDRSRENERLSTGFKHGGNVADLANRHDNLVALNGKGMILDHRRDRKRGRDCIGNNLPVRQKFSWKWTGETAAATRCWQYDGEEDRTSDDVPPTKFKCGVVMQGSSVFEGLRLLQKEGIIRGQLPKFVRDAPTLGSATITVDHGEFGGTNAFASV